MVQNNKSIFSVYAATHTDGSCNMACLKMFPSQQDRIDQNQQHIRSQSATGRWE